MDLIMPSNTTFNLFAQTRHTGATPYRREAYQYKTRRDDTEQYQSGSTLNSSTQSDSTQSSSTQSSSTQSSSTQSSSTVQSNRTNVTNPMATKKPKTTSNGNMSSYLTLPDRAADMRVRKRNIEYVILPEPDNGPTFHRERLQAETSRLLDVVRRWDDIRSATVELPESVGGEIDSTVGGIKLMLSSKFEQFRGLVDECAASYKVPSCIPVLAPRHRSRRPKRPPKPPVKPEDLDGFWDMMDVQLTAINRRIEDLERLRDNRWEPLHVHAQRSNSRAPVPKLVKKLVGKSKIREFLRKQKQEKNENKEEVLKTEDPIEFVVTARSPSKTPNGASTTEILIGTSNQMPLGTINTKSLGTHNRKSLDTPNTMLLGTPNTTSLGTTNQMPLGTSNMMSLDTHNMKPLGNPNMMSIGTPNQMPLGTPNIMSLGTPNMMLLGTPNTTSLGTPNLIPFDTPNTMSLGTPNLMPLATHNTSSLDTPNLVPLGTPNTTSLGTPNLMSLDTPNMMSLGTSNMKSLDNLGLMPLTTNTTSLDTPITTLLDTSNPMSLSTPNMMLLGTPNMPSNIMLHGTPNMMPLHNLNKTSLDTPNMMSLGTPNLMPLATHNTSLLDVPNLIPLGTPNTMPLCTLNKTSLDTPNMMSLGTLNLIPLGTPNMMSLGTSNMPPLATPNTSGFNTPTNTKTTPMPETPMSGSWIAAADAWELERILINIRHSTPKPTRVAPNGVMFSPYDPSDNGVLADRDLFQPIDKEKINILNEDATLKLPEPRSRRSSGFSTPRAELNMRAARRSRPSSIGILIQQSFFGKLILDIEEDEENSIPHSPISETSESSDTTWYSADPPESTNSDLQNANADTSWYSIDLESTERITQ